MFGASECTTDREVHHPNKRRVTVLPHLGTECCIQVQKKTPFESVLADTVRYWKPGELLVPGEVADGQDISVRILEPTGFHPRSKFGNSVHCL